MATATTATTTTNDTTSKMITTTPLQSPSKISELCGGPQPSYQSSAWSIMSSGLEINPHSAALISVQQPPSHLSNLVGPPPSPIITPAIHGPDKILTWSYAQMSVGAARLASVLACHGIPPDSTMLTVIPQSAEWGLFLWATALRCMTIVSIMPQFLVREEKKQELKGWAGKLKPTVWVVEDEGRIEVADEIRKTSADQGEVPFLGICLGEMNRERKGWISMADIDRMAFTEEESTPSPLEDRPDRVVHMFFTSGTTGAPKGVPKTVRNVCGSAAALSGPPTVGVILGGNFASMASTRPYLLWRNGSTAVLPSPRFSWGDVARAIEVCRVTDISVMRGHFSLLVGHKEFSVDRVKSLRRLCISGELITNDFVSRARDALGGQAAVLSTFGMSEGVGLLGWRGGVPPGPLPTYKGVVSCGKPLPGAGIRIVDERGAVIKRGEEGEMHVCSDGVFGGYMSMSSNEGDKRDAFYEDQFGQWYKTGDVAMIDEVGRVFVVGRRKELIRNVSGIIHPHVIESCLNAEFNVQVGPSL